MRIRNKKTGEIKEVSIKELNQYGLGGSVYVKNKLTKSPVFMEEGGEVVNPNNPVQLKNVDIVYKRPVTESTFDPYQQTTPIIDRGNFAQHYTKPVVQNVWINPKTGLPMTKDEAEMFKAQQIAQNQNPSSIRETVPVSFGRRVLDIVSNPMTAAQQAIAKEPITGRGPRNILDNAVDLVNPITYAKAIKNTTSNAVHPIETLKKLGNAGLGTLQYITEGNTNIPIGEGYGVLFDGLMTAGALKSAKPFLKTPLAKTEQFVNNLGNKFLKNASKTIPENAPIINPTVTPWTMQEFSGLQLQSTMDNGAISKIVEPKSGLVNTEQALAIIAKESGGADKVALIKQGLGENIPKKIDYNEFRKVVQDQLIPLERQFATNRSNYGIGSLGYPSLKRNGFETALSYIDNDITNLNKQIEITSSPIKKHYGQGLNGEHVYSYTDKYGRQYYPTKAGAIAGQERSLADLNESLNNSISIRANTLNEVQELPLENQTLILGNKSKFGKGSNAHGNPDETLGHIHFLRDAKTPDVLTVTQIQSDAFQGSNRIMPKNIKEAIEKLNNFKDEGKSTINIFNDGSESSNRVIANYEKHLQLKEASIKNFTQKSLLDKNHQERYLQELVDYAGKRGDVNKVRVPTSETAAKVQGYASKKSWNVNLNEGDKVTLLDGSTGIVTDNTFDNHIKITKTDGTKVNIDFSDSGYGPSKTLPVKFINNVELKEVSKFRPEDQTILKKYSELPKTIKKLFGQDVKIVTDSKNNSWYEFDIPKSFKEGRGQIKAFKHGGIIKDNMGQWAHPGQVTRINSNKITMQGIPYPVLGVDDTGYTQMMQPEMDYTFPGQYVTEYPMMQKGGLVKYQTGRLVKFNPYENVNRVSSSDGTRVFRLNPDQAENAKKTAAIRNEKIVKEYLQNQRSFIGPDNRTKAERDRSIAARKAYDKLVEKQKVMSQQPIYQFLQNTTPGGYNPNAAYNPVIGNTAGVLGYTAAGALLSPVVRPAFNFMGQVMNAPILGVAGFTGNNIVNAGFATHGLKSIMDGSVAKPWKEARKTGNPWDYANAVNENLMTSLELFPLVGPGYRGALKTGEYLTTQTPLKNTWKLNPISNKKIPLNKLYHKSNNPNLTLDDIDLFRIGKSQLKKRHLSIETLERPAGFYTSDEVFYPFMGGRSKYSFDFPANSKIKDLAIEGRITDRISQKELKKLADEGYDIIKGKNMIGQIEYIPLNKSKIQNWKFEGTAGQLSTIPGAADNSVFDHLKPFAEKRFQIIKPHWLKGYPQIKVPKQSIDPKLGKVLNKQGLINPVEIVDRIVPRINPFSFIEDGPDVMSFSPLNFISGYGKKLSGTKNQAFRKFGNSIQDVAQRQALSPAGGSKFKMGKNQILKEGNWAALENPWEKYSGVFEATFDKTVPNNNLSFLQGSSRSGVLIRDAKGNFLPEIPLTEPGMQLNRRLPFSTRYVPINKQKLIDGEFQLATQLPHLQSLTEKYGILAAGAGGLGYFFNGKKGAKENIKTLNKYTIDPIIKLYQKADKELNKGPKIYYKNGGQLKK